MRYPAAETERKHRKILEMATRLFQERGFGNVSVDTIMEAAGLTRGGFYSHFKSKRELVEKVIAAGAERSLALARSFEVSGEGRVSYVINYLSDRRLANAAEGTLESAMTSDIAREPELQGMFTAHLEALIEEFKRRFNHADADNPGAEAISLLCTIVGAAELARATNDEALRQRIVQAALRAAAR